MDLKRNTIVFEQFVTESNDQDIENSAVNPDDSQSSTSGSGLSRLVVKRHKKFFCVVRPRMRGRRTSCGPTPGIVKVTMWLQLGWIVDYKRQ